ncbi:MAG: saccharopine dehydrogenase NADP-binding domain-containing protein [Desulfobacterales bacterium]
MSNVSKKKISNVDIVLWGATSFVGQLLAAYLWPRYGETDEIRFAIGGRSKSKLESLHRDLTADDRLSLLVGDAADEDFLDGMTKNTKVVVSTVGPYAKYGSQLVAACAANGTGYCDLAGETQWMRRMIDSHQKDAEASGARIVHSCGFDSIPSDLGVLFLQHEARKHFGAPFTQVKLRVKSMRGGLSGGTIASILNFAEEARRDPEVVKIAKNPYSLAPEGMRSGIRQHNVSSVEYDEDAGSWIGPFLMGGVNTSVVHRSNALMNYPWGKSFEYNEAMMMGRGFMGAFRAATLTGGLGVFLLSALFAPTRFLMNRIFLPQPGEGPSPEQRENGFFNMHLIGKNADGDRLRVIVTGDRDPGYGSTSKMLGESAVCLLKEIPGKDLKGGFWTPSTAMGQKLIDRLIAHAGLTFNIIKES